MSHERPKPNTAFGFTEREVLWDRIGHGRFEKILADEQTTIHDIHLDSNNYGEFLFVTTSRPAGEQGSALTFFGLGYHEHRERWLADDWFWYETSLRDRNAVPLPKDEVLKIIQERHAEVLGYAAGQIQSERGKLFEVIADLTDDDGALSDFEDFGGWLSDDEF
jgi:hypothetical protein